MTRRRLVEWAIAAAAVGLVIGLLVRDVVPHWLADDVNTALIGLAFGWLLWDQVRTAIERRRARRRKVPTVVLDRGVSAELVMLLERVGDGTTQTPGTDLLRSWEIVFGHPPDLSRPIDEILVELTTAVRLMTTSSDEA